MVPLFIGENMPAGFEIPEDESLINEMELVEKIQIIRSRNNINWMALLKLALKYAPEETKEVMRDIQKCDGEINELTKQLAMEECFQPEPIEGE